MPFLLNITLYSLLVFLTILFTANIFFISDFIELDTLYAFFYHDLAQFPFKSLVYFSLLTIIIAIYSVIQILRKKKHGLYLFYFASIIVLLYLLLSKPIDKLNIFIIIALDYILFMFRSWFHVTNTQSVDIQENELIEAND